MGGPGRSGVQTVRGARVGRCEQIARWRDRLTTWRGSIVGLRLRLIGYHRRLIDIAWRWRGRGRYIHHLQRTSARTPPGFNMHVARQPYPSTLLPHRPSYTVVQALLRSGTAPVSHRSCQLKRLQCRAARSAAPLAWLVSPLALPCPYPACRGHGVERPFRPRMRPRFDRPQGSRGDFGVRVFLGFPAVLRLDECTWIGGGMRRLQRICWRRSGQQLREEVFSLRVLG
ncbi:hypothetical protein EJ06DRAFT_168510 [Trichodelitschia bisporula]|uniref:Uncharacterized protein n=1 Tax=Trichodelitschia bisporula TaxID=703511 RepID=A0A6G1HMW7_9PEZI|nr:hypothetical protein EJ06DRAFT_168510 [Trichodelitschia bisporula]